MEKLEKYKYYFRSGYGSDNLLIEFFSGVERGNFDMDLFDSLKGINPKLIGYDDLWMNDEVVYSVNSDLGRFELSKNIWNMAFIMSDDNQACMVQLNNLLEKDNRFERIEVEFNDYELSTNASR